MKIYRYAASAADQRTPHDSGLAVSASELAALGVLSYHLPEVSSVEDIARARNYKNRDEITVSPEAMGADIYESKVRTFFHEHLHEDEEIRYILDGAGYFDVRAKEEKGEEGDGWIRIRMEKGDLAILPAGIYHRFTPDEANYTKAMRLFKEEPKWTPLNRAPELEENPYRKAYVESLRSGVTA